MTQASSPRGPRRETALLRAIRTRPGNYDEIARGEGDRVFTACVHCGGLATYHATDDALHCEGYYGEPCSPADAARAMLERHGVCDRASESARSGATSRDPLLNVEARLYVEALTGRSVSPRGAAQCPFHRDLSALLVVSGKHWRCACCGRGGTIIDFGAALYSLDRHSFHEIRERLEADLRRAAA